jgi:hypothetical protein
MITKVELVVSLLVYYSALVAMVEFQVRAIDREAKKSREAKKK